MPLKIILSVILSTVTFADSMISLYKNETNEFAGVQGYVQYISDEAVGFISGSYWDYSSANIVCNELGK